MSKAAVGIRPKYDIFCEDASLQVYSPVPKKYLQKSSIKTIGMILRSRIPLKQLNSVGHHLPLKSISDKKAHSNTKKNRSQTQESLKRKIQHKIKAGKGKWSNKAKQPKLSRPNKQFSTPTSRYRSHRLNSPLTPVNPFMEDAPRRRRSKRLSGLGVDSPCLHLQRNPSNRKRSYKPDDFNEHLEMVACGIQTLQTNCSQLDSAIHQTYVSTPLGKRLRTTDGCVTRSDASYQQLNDGPLAQARGNALRRTMSRVAVRSRTMCNKFAKSASSLESHLHGRRGYRQVTSASQLDGCSNEVVVEE